MSGWIGSGFDCGGCPTVTCELVDEDARSFDYTIDGADTAWLVKTCFGYGGTTETTIPIDPPVSGSFIADANCYYTIFASGCGRTVSASCSNPSDGPSECFPCGEGSGRFMYGVISIVGIPDIVASLCTAGNGWSGHTWSDFGDWNGTFVWTGPDVVRLELGLGHIERTSPFNIRYGIVFQCGTARLAWCYEYEDFQVTNRSVGGDWTHSYDSLEGACADSLNPDSINVYTTNPASSSIRYHEDCPVSSRATLEYLPALYGSYQLWLVTEFS